MAAVQRAIVLPWGTPVPASNSRVVVRLVVDAPGSVEEANLVQGLSPAVDQAVLAAVRVLSFPLSSPTYPLQTARPTGVNLRGLYTLSIPAPGAATAAQRQEAHTRWQQTARRLPGEGDSTFVRRVLPLSCPTNPRDWDLLAYAWRPGAFGKQLFFTRRGGEDNDDGTDLFILDPYAPDTYAVQVVAIPGMDDLTNIKALFFADANHDGRTDLLALAEWTPREQRKSTETGEMLDGHWPHYATFIWQYAGLNTAGRPQYREDPTPRPYLDELPTAAAVRQALARPPRRHPQPKERSTE